MSADLSMPSMLEVVGDIIGLWLLIVSFQKEIRRKTNGAQFRGTVYFIGLLPYPVPYLMVFFLSEKRNR